MFVCGGEERDSAQGGGEEDLHRQYRVDFAHELHADVKRSFGDGSAELWMTCQYWIRSPV